MRLIELKDRRGLPFYINADHIVAIGQSSDSDNRAVIHTSGGEKSVKETIQEVLDAIELPKAD